MITNDEGPYKKELNMEPTVGQKVHFYRDKSFPGNRGPYPAEILFIRLGNPHAVNLRVTGSGGGVYTEYQIPYLTGEFEEPETRYCTPTG